MNQPVAVPQASRSHAPGDAARQWHLVAILLSTAASGAHIGMTPDHLREPGGLGVLMLAGAAFQAVFAVLLLYRGFDPRFLAAGIAANALLVGLFVVAHGIVTPWFGPGAAVAAPDGWADASARYGLFYCVTSAYGQAEPIGWFELATQAMQVGLIVCLAVLRRIVAPSGAPHR